MSVMELPRLRQDEFVFAGRDLTEAARSRLGDNQLEVAYDRGLASWQLARWLARKLDDGCTYRRLVRIGNLGATRPVAAHIVSMAQEGRHGDLDDWFRDRERQEERRKKSADSVDEANAEAQADYRWNAVNSTRFDSEDLGAAYKKRWV